MKTSKITAIIILLFLFCIFFYRQLFYGEIWFCCDNLLINIPAKVMWVSEVANGRIPLWNPYLLSGMPFFADLNLSLLHPSTLFFFLWEPFLSLKRIILLQLFINLVGMYFLGIKLKLSRISAVISSIVYGFSSSMIIYTNNLPMLSVAVLLPWGIWSIINYFDKQSLKNFVKLIFILTIQIFAGSVQFTFYSWIFYLIYIFIIPKQSLKYKFLYIFYIVLVVGLLTAVQILPFLELSASSTRLNRGYNYATFDSLNPLYMIRFMVPSIVGNIHNGTSWLAEGSNYGYLGILPLILVLFVKFRLKIVKILLLTAAASLLLAFGKYFPLYWLILKIFPIFGLFRSPQHFLLLYTFSMAILAGFGNENINEKLKFKNSSNKLINTGFIFLFLAVSLYLTNNFLVSFLKYQNFSEKLNFKLQTLSEANLIIIIKQIANNLFFIALIIIIFAIINKSIRKSSPKKILIVLLIFTDLFIFSRRNLITVSNTKITHWSTETRMLVNKFKNFDWRNDRFWTDPLLYPAPRLKLFGLVNYDEESKWQIMILRPNLNILYGIPIIDGYSSLVYDKYQEFFKSKSTDPTGINLGSADETLLKELGVKYILGPKSNSLVELNEVLNPKYRLRLITDNHSGLNSLTIKSYYSNEVVVETKSDSQAKLIFIDTNYPGWKAYVNNKNIPIEPYLNVFKSVNLDSGLNLVKFVYLPKSFQVGSLLSLVGLLIYLYLLINVKLKRK